MDAIFSAEIRSVLDAVPAPVDRPIGKRQVAAKRFEMGRSLENDH